MLKANKNRNQKNQSTSRASANAMFEPLEQRRMMSADFFATSVYAPPPVLHAPPTSLASSTDVTAALTAE